MSDLEENLRGLSDADLDDFFATSRGQAQGAAAREITSRLTSVWSFVTGLFGKERFPKYAAATAFSQAGAAQSSVSDSAAKAVDAVSGATWKIGMPLFLIAGIAIGVYIFLKKK